MDRFRRWTAFLLALLGLTYLLGAVLDPPFLRPLMRLSCHRLPHRSLQFPWGVAGQCARCTGFWLGVLVSAGILYMRNFPGSPVLGLVLLAPMAVDGTVQFFSAYESTQMLRLVTGTAAGAGLVMLLSRALEGSSPSGS